MLVAITIIAMAAIPAYINYQGKLTDTDLVGINDTLDMELLIYDTETGGTEIWSMPAENVEIVHGLFNVEIGPLDLPFGEQYWLEIIIDGDVMAPRQRLTAEAYAFRAKIADSLAGGFSVDNMIAHWDSLRGIPSDIADGDDDIIGTHDTMIAHWDSLRNMPSGFADGVDNDGGDDGDWTISGDNIHSSVDGNVGIGVTLPVGKLHSILRPDTVIGGSFADGFEDGTLEPFVSYYPSWTVSSSEVYQDTYCAKSGEIPDGALTEMELTMSTVAGNISFAVKVSSEEMYDFLRFYIDDVLKGNWTGDIDWFTVSYPITEDIHTFKWRYEKDAATAGYSDCAWIDNIQLPESLIVTSDASAGIIADGTRVGPAAIFKNGEMQVINGRVEFKSTNDASMTPASGVLEIANSLRIDGNEIITNESLTLYINHDNSGDVSIDNGSFYVEASSNNIGIGTASPFESVDVVGNVRADDFIEYSSDYLGDAISILKNVKTREGPREWRPVEHKSWPSEIIRKYNIDANADDIYLPDDAQIETGEDGQLTVYGRSLNGMVSIHTRALQQLIERTEKLEAENSILAAQNRELIKSIKKLEKFED